MRLKNNYAIDLPAAAKPSGIVFDIIGIPMENLVLPILPSANDHSYRQRKPLWMPPRATISEPGIRTLLHTLPAAAIANCDNHFIKTIILWYVQLINKIRYCLLSGFWIRKDRWQSGFCGRHVREPAKIDSLIKTRGVIFVHISTKMGTKFVNNVSSTYSHPYNLNILLIPAYSISQEKWIKARATPAKKCLGARY